MNAIKVKENIYWVGAIDWQLRNFHGYLTHRGSTYNAYLVIDEKITLIDTVKDNLTDEMLSRISSVIDISKIDQIISNHAEPDHSGAISKVLEYAPNAKIYAVNAANFKALSSYCPNIKDIQSVKGGDKISLGKRTLEFIPTPMVHWPDNMLSYMAEEKLLFSNDAFGQHYASNERFDDQTPVDEVMFEAKKYYANIVQPYNAQVVKALSAAANLDIEIIAPSHGIIWRKNIAMIIDAYKKWSSAQTTTKAVIAYDTMWHSTESMARAIETAFLNKNIAVKLYNLSTTHPSDVMSELMDAEYVAVGSPTLNNGILATVASFMTYFKGLNGTNKKFVAFGSYGWGGQSIGILDKWLEDMKLERLSNPIRFNYKPNADELKEITKNLENLI